MSPLASVTELGTLLKLPALAPDDPYAVLIVTQASNAVRDAARAAGVTAADGWVLENPGTGQTIVPAAAHDITLWVAQRAYTNPRNLSRRTSGPVSESYFENGIYGLDLTDGERERLSGLAPSRKGGLWVQPIDTGSQYGLLTVPADMLGGDPLYIADMGQYPYVYDPAPGAPPVPYDGPVGGV